jgi:hypothetical protein
LEERQIFLGAKAEKFFQNRCGTSVKRAVDFESCPQTVDSCGGNVKESVENFSG